MSAPSRNTQAALGVSQWPQRTRPKRTISRQAQDWQFPSRNRLGRASECSAWNAVAHIQASGHAPTIRMVARLIHKDYRQTQRVLKRLEHAGLLEWRHREAVYRNNRLQYVPIALRWDSLRLEPTMPSTSEPTIAKSLGTSFLKNQNRYIERDAPQTLPSPETEKENSTPTANPTPLTEGKKHVKGQNEPTPHESYCETWGNYPESVEAWEKDTGFQIPDRDLDSIIRVMEAKSRFSLQGFDRALLAFMVETVWSRATQPEKHWKAYYATALLKMVSSDRAFFGVESRFHKRNYLYQKWRVPEADVEAWNPARMAEYRRKAANIESLKQKGRT